jgi:hypothetical protein
MKNLFLMVLAAFLATGTVMWVDAAFTAPTAELQRAALQIALLPAMMSALVVRHIRRSPPDHS